MERDMQNARQVIMMIMMILMIMMIMMILMIIMIMIVLMTEDPFEPPDNKLKHPR